MGIWCSYSSVINIRKVSHELVCNNKSKSFTSMGKSKFTTDDNAANETLQTLQTFPRRQIWTWLTQLRSCKRASNKNYFLHNDYAKIRRKSLTEFIRTINRVSPISLQIATARLWTANRVTTSFCRFLISCASLFNYLLVPTYSNLPSYST